MTAVRCPKCGRRFDSEQSPALPFCSDRCRLIDLGGWLEEKYGVPVVREDDEGDEPAADEEPEEEP